MLNGEAAQLSIADGRGFAPPLNSALCAYATKLTWLYGLECFKDRGDKWLEVHHSVGGRENKKYSEGQPCNVLLELDAAVHGEQCVVLAMHPSKKVAVLDAGPTTGGDGDGAVAFEHGGEI